MTWMSLRRPAAMVAMVLFPLVSAASLSGCGALDVSDPTAIEQGELENATGANLLRLDALRRLYVAIGAGAWTSGILADEFFAETPAAFVQLGLVNPDEILDRRESVQYEAQSGSTNFPYSRWQEARQAATLAMPGLRAHVGPARVGEMFTVRGLAALWLAEHVCPGFPLHAVVDYTPVYGGPLSTDQAFERALADFDTALVLAADSARILNWARVGRARALLGLGRFAEAGAAAASVPTSYLQNAEYNSASQANTLAAFIQFGDRRLSVANNEGGTGLNFISAGDPRVQGMPIGPAQDGTSMYAPAKYPNANAPIVLASGLEARLIEAEAALKAGGDWLGILNALRAAAGLPALTDPGTPAARVDLLFRERAFWLFATGHRLGDLRRLVTRYSRTPQSVFPSGAYRLGGTYSTATSIPFPAALETPFNPAVTGCTSR